MKKNQKRLIGLGLIGIVGLVIWNTPGVKSRRLGDACDRRGEPHADICRIGVARDYTNSQVCDKVVSVQMKELCYVNVRFGNKSVDFCERDEQRDICLHIVSIKQGDKSICSRINNESIRSLCLGNIE